MKVFVAPFAFADDIVVLAFIGLGMGQRNPGPDL